jgi:hypothetical protein
MYINGFPVANVTVVDPTEPNESISVTLQDPTSRILSLKFIKAAVSPVSITSDIAIEDTTINLTDATGFVDGNIVGLFSGTGFFYFGRQVGAPVGNTITVDTPIDSVFTSATSAAISASANMAVDGSTTTQIYQIGPIGQSIAIAMDITKIIGYIQSASPMDDSRFGSLTELTNGIVLRKHDGDIQNIWTVKSNDELSTTSGIEFEYTSKAPSGSYGARFKNTFAGTNEFGAVIRLEAGETLEVLIQDDLSSLQKLTLSAHGHFVVD